MLDKFDKADLSLFEFPSIRYSRSNKKKEKTYQLSLRTGILERTPLKNQLDRLQNSEASDIRLLGSTNTVGMR